MRKTPLFSVGFIAALCIASTCGAKQYSVEAMRINAVVSADGSIRVTEDITYDFDGRFSYAYRDIPLKSGEDLVDVRVSEDANRFERAEGDEPWTYSVSRTDGNARVTWHYTARNETRTFALSYTITGVVRRYTDVAEIYYKCVGEEWDLPIGRVDVELRLPEGVNASDVRAWAHGPLHGTVSILAGVVSLNISPLPPRTYWEARVACPSDVFNEMAPASGGPRLSAILREETAWAEESNRLRAERQRQLEEAAVERERRAGRARAFLPISILLGAAALGLWLWGFTRYGRPHAVSARVAPGEIPSDHPPAVLSYLMNRAVTGPAVAATMIDLASRGYLEIHESVIEKKGLFGKRKPVADYRFDVVAKPLSELRPFERDFLHFVLNEVGDSTGFTISALREFASRRHSTVARFFRTWNKQVAEYSKSFHFYEPYAVRAMVWNAVCGAVVMGLGITMVALWRSPVGIAALAGGFLQAVLTVALNRRTPEGRGLMMAWKAFRSHLKTIARRLGPVTLESSQWGRYLAVAILFGLHKGLLPKLRLSGAQEAAAYPVWFYGAHGAGLDGGISGLATGVSTMVTTVSTAMSSAAGAGGGASAGGGGGSGGGGGGAG